MAINLATRLAVSTALWAHFEIVLVAQPSRLRVSTSLSPNSEVGGVVFLVAQICNLLYRRIAFGKAW
jgi:hypothetical protein